MPDCTRRFVTSNFVAEIASPARSRSWKAAMSLSCPPKETIAFGLRVIPGTICLCSPKLICITPLDSDRCKGIEG